MDEKRRRKGEEGVALIVVLGFLSLMLVIAVAFLSTAQVERQVSDASLEAIRSRQLLRSALSAAMNDYSRELWREKLYLPDKDYEVFTAEWTRCRGADATSLGRRPICCGGSRWIGFRRNTELYR